MPALVANPFIRFVEDPVTTSALAAYACLLFAALVATWYVLGRNLLTLYVNHKNSSWVLPPGPWAARALGVFVILAIDFLLVGALFWLVQGG